MQTWLAKTLDVGSAVFAPLQPTAVAARFRYLPNITYFRITTAGVTHIVMDASAARAGAQLGAAQFITAAKLIETAGINTTRLVARDASLGFALFSDPGTTTYLDAMHEDNTSTFLRPAADALLQWQLSSKPDLLPVLTPAILRAELELFQRNFLINHLAMKLTDAQIKILAGVFDSIIAANLVQDNVFVHRDFVPQNLIVSTAGPGILGFGNAGYGPISYDIASLYKDVFKSFDEEVILDGTIRYWEKAKKAGLPVKADFGDFYRDVEWTGLQRHLYLLGVFAETKIDSNAESNTPNMASAYMMSAYMADAPRFLRYIRSVGERYTALFPLIRLFDALKINDGVTRTVGVSF